MKIDIKGTIGGQPSKIVRDVMRELGETRFTVKGVAEELQRLLWRAQVEAVLGSRKRDDANGELKLWRDWRRDIVGGDWQEWMNREHAAARDFARWAKVKAIPDQTKAARVLVEHLQAEGFVELTDEPRTDTGMPWYRGTKKGSALAMTRLLRRMPRAKAEVLLKEVLARVEEYNANPDLLQWITEVRVFGSYLTDTADLGDLDVAIKVARHPLEDYVKAGQIILRASGKTVSTFINQLYFAEHELWRRIKKRSPYLSLHDTKELDDEGYPSRTVYSFVPSKVDILRTKALDPSAPLPRRRALQAELSHAISHGISGAE